MRAAPFVGISFLGCADSFGVAFFSFPCDSSSSAALAFGGGGVGGNRRDGLYGARGGRGRGRGLHHSSSSRNHLLLSFNRLSAFCSLGLAGFLGNSFFLDLISL